MKIFFYLPAILSSVLLAASFPPFSYGILIYIALVPVLWSLHRCRTAKESATLMGLTGALFFAATLFWFTKVFGVFAVSLYFLLALVWSAFGYFYFRLKESRALWLAPVLWTGLEFFRSEVWYFDFPWMSLGLAHNTDFLFSGFQTASLWGMYGTGFIIFIVNQCLACTFALKEQKQKVACFVAAVMIAAVLVPIAARFEQSRALVRTESAPTKILLVQSEDYTLEELERLTTESRFSDGLILWPEYQVAILPGERLHAEIFRRMSNIAKRANSVLVAGCAEFVNPGTGATREKLHNFAAVFNPDGTVAGTYTKQRLIPLMEKFVVVKGKSSQPVAVAQGKLGIAICYDMDFTSTFVELARNGAGFIAVPSLDPVRWGKTQHLQHASIARVRAVESRKWIARSCSSGPSQMVNPLGREVAQTKFGETVALESAAAFVYGRTIYHRYLWLFPWLCTVTAAGIMLSGTFGKMKEKYAKPT